MGQVRGWKAQDQREEEPDGMMPDITLFTLRYWKESDPSKRAIIRDEYRWLCDICDALMSPARPES